MWKVDTGDITDTTTSDDIQAFRHHFGYWFSSFFGIPDDHNEIKKIVWFATS